MAHGTIVTLKDYNTTPLWDGEEILLLGTTIRFEGSNTVSGKPKTFQLLNLQTEDTDAGDTEASYINNYNRRKYNNTYAGFNNVKITATIVYNPDEVGDKITVNSTQKMVFTPNKLFELILKPRTMYLKDEFIINLLTTTETTIAAETIPAVYSSRGIPVLLTSWDMSPAIEGKEIIINLTFIEDKEVS